MEPFLSRFLMKQELWGVPEKLGMMLRRTCTLTQLGGIKTVTEAAG